MNAKTPVRAEDARKQATVTIAEAQKQAKTAQKQARRTVREARKQARRQLVQARIAAARARTGAQTKASGLSAKAVGAAGAVGLAAGYFLDPESGKRRRNVARDRALGMVRRGTHRARREAEQRTSQVEG